MLRDSLRRTHAEAIARPAEDEERKGQARVEQIAETLIAAGTRATPVLVRGDAATKIIEYGKTHEIDLVVARSRGLGAVKGWWMGGASRKPVRYAVGRFLDHLKDGFK